MSQQKTLAVRIIATDGASQSFVTVGKSAAGSAASIEAASGRSSQAMAKQTAAAANLEREFTTTSASVGGFSRSLGLLKGAVAGVGFSALTGALSEAARLAAVSEASQARLSAAIEATGKDYELYAARVDKATAAGLKLSFDDEKVQDALAGLTQQTGDAGKALDLLNVSMDLARGRHIDLETAATIVGKVAQGNIAILQRYGIQIDDNATSTEALAAIQKTFAGQSESYAGTTQGNVDRVTNAIENQMEAIGAATGPAQTFIALLPGMSAGFTAISAAAGGAAEAIGITGGLSGALAAGVPLMGALGAAALIAAPAIVAVALAAHQAAEAQAEWNAEQDAGTKFLQSLGETGTDQTIRDIVDAFAQWNTVTTVTFGDTTIGLEDVNKMLLTLDETSVKALGHFVESVGGLSPETIGAVADEVVRLYQVEEQLDKTAQAMNATNVAAALAAYDLSAGLHESTDAAVAAYAAINQRGLPLDDWIALRDAANDATTAIEQSDQAMRDIAANSAAGGVISFPTVGDPEQVKAATIAIDAYDRKAAEAKKNDEEAARQAEQNARERASLEDQLVTAVEHRADAVKQAAQVEQDAIAKTREIEHAYVKDQQDAEKTLSQGQRDIAAQRVDLEKETTQKLNDLEQQRRDVAAETESQLADLAAQRSQVQQQAAADLASAEKDFLQTSAEINQKQVDIRRELAGQMRDAAQQFADLQHQQQQQLADIRETLRDATKDAQESHDRSVEDINLRVSRATEDLQTALADPNLTPERRAQLELDYQRELEDATTDRNRLEEDFANDQADRENQARDDERALEKEKRQALRDYHEERKSLEDDADQKLKDLTDDQKSAAAELAKTQQGIRDDAISALDDIDTKQADIISNEKTRFAQLDDDKRKILSDAAIAQRTLARDSAQLEAGYNRDVTQAVREHEKAVKDAGAAYTEAAANADKAIGDIDSDIADIQGKIDAIGTETVAPVTVQKSPTFDADAASVSTEIDTSLAIDEDRIIHIGVAATPTFDADVAAITAKLDGFLDTTYYTKLDATYSGLTDAITEAEKAGDAFAAMSYTASLKGNWGEVAPGEGGGLAQAGPSTFLGAVLDAEMRGDEFARQTYTASLSATNVAVGEAILAAEGELDEYAAKVYAAQIDVAKHAEYEKDKNAIANDLLSAFVNADFYAEVRPAKGQDWDAEFARLKQAIERDFATIKFTVTAEPGGGTNVSDQAVAQRALGGASASSLGAGSWYIAGEHGPELIWDPSGGDMIWSAGATAARLAANGDIPGFAHGGRNSGQQVQAASGSWKDFVDKQSKQVQQILREYRPGNPNRHPLSHEEKMQLMSGDLVVLNNGDIVPRGSNYHDYEPLPLKGVHQQPGPPASEPPPKPETPPPAEVPPKPEIPPPAGVPPPPTTPLPSSDEGIARDLPPFGQSALTASAIARAAFAAGGDATTAQASLPAISGTANVGDLANVMRQLVREVSRLSQRIENLELGSAGANYGSIYVQQGPGLSETTAAVRAAATLNRIG